MSNLCYFQVDRDYNKKFSTIQEQNLDDLWNFVLTSLLKLYKSTLKKPEQKTTVTLLNSASNSLQKGS